MTEANAWGPLAEPIHGPVPEGRPAWKDNAFLNFWDPDHEIFGCAHVSTSPNAEGRRARFSISVRGRVVEIIDDLRPGSFASPTIDFDLDKGVTVAAAQLSGWVRSEPVFSLADYTAGGTIPALVAGEPLHHVQRAARVTGALVLDGETVAVDGSGFRDRTWGYRDESVTWSEYIAFLILFDDYALTGMRFRSPDGREGTEGYLLREVGTEPQDITAIGVTRDASGLAAATHLTLGDGTAMAVRSAGRVGGFWVPMGWERRAPAMSCYDEFAPVSTDHGDHGFGMFEHGIIRQLF
jgi:hypothetical protein